MFARLREPIVLGIVLTIGFLLFSAWLIHPRWASVLKLDLNNLGDFLAGISSTLAFLWLIIAVLLQREELQEQRREIRQSTEALRATALQAETQSRIMQEQLRIAIDERRYREATYAASRLGSELISAAELLRNSKIFVSNDATKRICAFDLTALRTAYEAGSYEAIARSIRDVLAKDTRTVVGPGTVPQKAHGYLLGLSQLAQAVINSPEKSDLMDYYDPRIKNVLRSIARRSGNLINDLTAVKSVKLKKPNKIKVG